LDLITVTTIALLLFVALVFSPLGLGGGVLYVPILHYLSGWEIQEAVIGSLTLVFMVALGSSLAHSNSGHADNKVANTGRITAIPFAIIGTILSGILFSLAGDIVFKILAAFILTFVIERTISAIIKEEGDAVNEVQISEKKQQYQLGTAFAGISSGLLGIGGGAILVTLNRSLLKMDMHKAAGTSFLVGITIVPVALLSHILLDGIARDLFDKVGLIGTLVVPLLVFLCAFIGAKIAIKHISKIGITVVFLCAISVSLIRYIFDFISMV